MAPHNVKPYITSRDNSGKAISKASSKNTKANEAATTPWQRTIRERERKFILFF
jgi:hypothetical protein